MDGMEEQQRQRQRKRQKSAKYTKNREREKNESRVKIINTLFISFFFSLSAIFLDSSSLNYEIISFLMKTRKKKKT